ncbi:MAG: cytochrome c, partial [Cellvibrionales bacterium]
AVSQGEFDAWRSAKQADQAAQVAAASVEMSLDDLMSEGEAVYNRQCLACHGAQGEGGVGNAIAGSAVALGDIGKHLDVGIKGVAGTAMQAFGAQLTDVEMAAVITYQRNAFGNNTGDVVQPSDVAQHKQG